jgi:hypothetical protein
VRFVKKGYGFAIPIAISNASCSIILLPSAKKNSVHSAASETSATVAGASDISDVSFTVEDKIDSCFLWFFFPKYSIAKPNKTKPLQATKQSVLYSL